MESAGFLFLLCAALVNCACSTTVNPIGKVLELLADLEQKIIKEGESYQKTYKEFATYCQVTSNNLHYEINTEKRAVANLEATIEKAASDISVYSETIKSDAAAIASYEAELKSATEIRTTEHKKFKKDQLDISTAKDAVDRAMAIVSREMDKGTSFVQMQGAQDVVQLLSTMLEASSVNTADAATMTGLLQSFSSSDDADEDEEVGAPAAPVYESHSQGLLETLEGLVEKGAKTYARLIKDETDAAHAYELARQSLEDRIQTAMDSMADAKKAEAAASEAKATAEGDLSVTEKDLAADKGALDQLHHDCLEKADNFEEETKSRAEELKALADAKKVIKETTGGAVQQSYGLNQMSFLQLRSVAKRRSSQGSQVIRFVRKLAVTHRSGALMQLASRMEVAIRSMERSGASDEEDPFAKVKGLIEDMISRLTEEASAEAAQKAFCDKEIAENTLKKENKQADIEQMSANIASLTIKSQALQAEVATLQKELADSAEAQAEMTKLRQEEKAQYDANKPEMEAGLEGVKQGLKVLRDYYGQADLAPQAAAGSAQSIIALLEVCESDFQKGLTEMIASEEAAVGKYEEETKAHEISVAVKTEDVKYKTKEYTSLDKVVAETTSDKEGVSNELAAVQTYLGQLEKQCVARPDTYEERAKRRAQEIAGLKEALQILDGEAFLQVHSVTRHTLRGAALQPSV